MNIRTLLFRRQRKVEEQLRAYMGHWGECIDYFRRGMDTYLEEGPGEQFDYYYRRVDQEESKGDELRRAIGGELFGKALLPESRGDILRILESLDQVINRSESVVRMAVIQRITVEEWMVPEIRRLMEAIVDACRLLREAAGHLLQGIDDPVGDLAHEVQELESRCDHLELDLIERVFASDLELARKLQLKDFVLRLGSVADLAEGASDRMYVVSVKRRV
jgi:predicted phosphate transport protein (TIGR00153 family)